MIMSSSRCALVLIGGILGLLFSGCAAPVQVKSTRVMERPKTTIKAPTPKKVERPRGKLGNLCATSEIEGCAAAQAITEQVERYHVTHRQQMAELEKLLVEFARILNMPEAVPRAAIQAHNPDTGQWTEPQASYPVQITVRLDYDRGLERLGPLVPTLFEDALKRLEATISRQNQDWTTLIRESNVVEGSRIQVAVPREIALQRRAASVIIELVGRTTRLKIPKTLAKRHMRRDALPWAGLASHVVTEHGLEHKLVQEHAVEVQPALTVVETGEKGLGLVIIRITENPAARVKKTMVSQVKISEFCKKLRAQLRFVPVGRVAPMTVKVVTAATGEVGQ